jgi:pSer/pThr/pTyr-binding forkhead associated (FHA) protein
MGDETIKLIGLTGNYRGKEYEMTGDEFTVGRSKNNDLVLDENTISGRHAKFVRKGEQWELIDENSTNGTFVNGEKITNRIVRPDDLVKFDEWEFSFKNTADVARTIVAEPVITEKQTVAREEKVITEPPTPAQEPQPQRTPQPQPAPRPKVKPAGATATAQPRAGGNLIAGLIVGVILAAVIAYAGFLIGQMIDGAYGWNMVDTVRGTTMTFAWMHTHHAWFHQGMSWSAGSVVVFVGLVVSLLFGGWVANFIARTNAFVVAISFAILYALIFLIASMAVAGFNMDRIQMMGMGTAGLSGWAAVGVLYVYFFAVSLVLTFIGAAIARK